MWVSGSNPGCQACQPVPLPTKWHFLLAFVFIWGGAGLENDFGYCSSGVFHLNFFHLIWDSPIPRDSPVSISPVLGLQAYTHTWLFTWMLGYKLNVLVLAHEHFTHATISPALN